MNDIVSSARFQLLVLPAYGLRASGTTLLWRTACLRTGYGKNEQ
jgi:hypothetical protein